MSKNFYFNGIQNTELTAIILNDIYNNGQFPHHIDSMNDFYTTGLNEILTNIFRVERVIPNIRSETDLDRKISTIKFIATFSNTNLSKPMDDKVYIFPAYCRKKNKSYLGILTCDIKLTATAYFHTGETKVIEDTIDKFEIAELPIMTGTILCNTYGMNKKALELIGEDPGDPQGIFLINGSEWIVNNLISRKYNIWHVFHNEYMKEHARAEFISIPGDTYGNSSEMIISYNTDEEITITLTSDRYFKLVPLPFYVLLKLFGIPTDSSIMENIITKDDKETELGDKMHKLLENAFLAKYKHLTLNMSGESNVGELLNLIINELAVKYINTKGIVNETEKEKSLEIEKKIIKEVIMYNFDNNVMPHLGKTGEHRFHKALYVCIGIRKLLNCYFDIVPETDRDSNCMKRKHPPGVSFAKTFKKEFNNSIVASLRKSIDEVFINSPFDSVDLASVFKTACRVAGLKSKIIASLNTGMGEKIEKGKKIINRMPSENRKIKVHCNSVNNGAISKSTNPADAFSNARAHEMRAEHSTFTGNNCLLQSAEGVSVGINQHTTLGLKISTSSSSDIAEQLLKNINIISYDTIFGVSNHYTKISVNGKWLGYIENPDELYNEFIYLRRGFDYKTGQRIKSKIIMDRYMTICYDRLQKEIDFRTDRGRTLTPFVVVYNNTDAVGHNLVYPTFTSTTSEAGSKVFNRKSDKYDIDKFEQGILLTKEHIRQIKKNEITINDLFNEGIIEYISPEEYTNIVCAESFEYLKRYMNNLYNPYTHLLIPISILSFTSAIIPHSVHCPPTRITYAGNHCRQACGIYAANYDHRYDKQGYIMFGQFPLTYTISNLFTSPFGINVFQAVIPMEGGNIEDSIYSNKTMFERGAYYVSKFTMVIIELEKNEDFGLPNERNTDNINLDANYNKLDDKGFIPRGTKVNKKDMIVGKIYKYPEIKTNNIIYKDVSVLYGEEEEGTIVDYEEGTNSTLNKFIKYRIEIARPMSKGQKMSSRNGQKSMVAKTAPQSDFPFTNEGIIPGFLLGPPAYPSRMTVNQQFEGITSLYALFKGQCYDSTFGVYMDYKEIGDVLEDNGWYRNGTQVMYNGTTGKFFNTSIMLTPVYQLRLQKFYQEGEYVVGDWGQKSPTTRQPISGRQRDGGIRLGEMEKDCLFSIGATRFITNKLLKDCDGYTVNICRTCGYRSKTNNNKYNSCLNCKSQSNIVTLPMRFSVYKLHSVFEAMNINIKYGITPYTFIFNK